MNIDDARADRDAAMAPGPDLSANPNWRIRDADGASWALRKKGKAERDLATIEAAYNEERAKLDAWFEKAAADTSDSISRLNGHLELWFRDLRREDPDLHTRRLPGGTLTHRGSQALIILDKDALVAWAKTNAPGLVVTEERIKIDDLKKQLAKDEKTKTLVPVTKDGIAVPGVKVETRDNYKAVAATETTSGADDE